MLHNEVTTVTIDEALQYVADASFYEDIAIRKLEDGSGYNVSPTTAHASDEWVWSYAEGIHGRNSVSETSRLHDPAELYNRASHIRYNMPDSVEAIKDGKIVEFAYAIVDIDDSELEHDDECERPAWDAHILTKTPIPESVWTTQPDCQCDRLAGWILVANHYDAD